MINMLEQKNISGQVDAKHLSRIKNIGKTLQIDAEGMHYKDLNCLLRSIVKNKDVEKIEIHNVCGQRYIGTDLDSDIQIDVYGTPGNDLGVFMSGPKLTIHGNAQDASGNTMNEGKMVIHGHAGDLTGHSMRGGKIFVRDYVGYRVGIHMKEYQRKIPQIVIGQTAGDFLAEYMAGGVILLLGLNLKEDEKCKARFVGTGMHGGVIYERGDILEPEKGTKIQDANKRDTKVIESLVREFSGYFGINAEKILNAKFKKIVPLSKRPYEKLYSH
jgi:glutamate synthase domain-containing protein 3